MWITIMMIVVFWASCAFAVCGVKVINFDTGAEIVVKHKTKLKLSDIVIVHKVAKNIWVSYNKKDDKYIMRYIPMKEYKEKQLVVNKMLANITKITEEVLVSIPTYPPKTFSLKFP